MTETASTSGGVDAAAPRIGERRIVLEPREVPLGGVRGMNVLRVLPHRNLPTIGAWCFLDRFGPADTRMRVEPHPHIGLQTVTWPLVGEIRHRDSLGSDADLRRGQLNLMTAGNGISHSEYSIGEDPIPLDALQLWVVLPDGARQGAGGFERHTDLPRSHFRPTTARRPRPPWFSASSPASPHLPPCTRPSSAPRSWCQRAPASDFRCAPNGSTPSCSSRAMRSCRCTG